MEYKNEKHKLNCERWEFVRNLAREEYEELGYKNPNLTRAWYRCRVCNNLKNIQKSCFKVSLTLCNMGCYGHAHAGHIVTKENCIATTHKHTLPYFLDKKDAYKYSAGSSKKVLTKCLDCGHEKRTKVHTLAVKGFRCPLCGDSVTYPERFVWSLLKYLNIKFTPQFTFKGSRNRYDFYIESLSMIIEVNGIQHYEQSSRKGARTLKEEQENDKIKKNFAIKNGIKHYIIIDSRYSELEWMRVNIMNSELPTLLNFTVDSVEWSVIECNSRSNLVKEVCNYFARNTTSTYEMQEVFGLSVQTIINYLKQGSELGWCKYNPKDFKKNPKQVKGVHKTTGDIVIFSSVCQAGKWLGKKGYGDIVNCCKGKRKSSHGYVWSYIDEDETNNQTQSS